MTDLPSHSSSKPFETVAKTVNIGDAVILTLKDVAVTLKFVSSHHVVFCNNTVI
jgi:hypothetical protein